MKLDDFLKVKQVRCVKGYGRHLTVGETYHVLGLSVPNNLVQVENDNGFITEYDFGGFEPVLDSAENPLQDMKLTPEFEAVEPVLADNRQVNIQDIGTDILDTNADIKDTPKFKVGNKVYKYGETDVKTVLEVFENGYMRISNYPHRVNHEVLCHATPENHALLSKPFPAIEFEQPPKPVIGIELAKKLIAKGHNYLVVDTVIGIRVLTRLEGNTLIDSNNVRLDELDDITPLNDETGEPLTEAMLDE